MRIILTKNDLTTIQNANNLVSWGSVTLDFAQFFYVRLASSLYERITERTLLCKIDKPTTIVTE
jgi:hypothetical protein